MTNKTSLSTQLIFIPPAFHHLKNDAEIRYHDIHGLFSVLTNHDVLYYRIFNKKLMEVSDAKRNMPFDAFFNPVVNHEAFADYDELTQQYEDELKANASDADTPITNPLLITIHLLGQVGEIVYNPNTDTMYIFINEETSPLTDIPEDQERYRKVLSEIMAKLIQYKGYDAVSETALMESYLEEEPVIALNPRA